MGKLWKISLSNFNNSVLFESLQKAWRVEASMSGGINTGSIWTTQVFQDTLCVITYFQHHDKAAKEDPSMLMNNQGEERSILRAESCVEEVIRVLWTWPRQQVPPVEWRGQCHPPTPPPLRQRVHLCFPLSELFSLITTGFEMLNCNYANLYYMWKHLFYWSCFGDIRYLNSRNINNQKRALFSAT